MNDQQRAAMQMALEALEGVGEQTFFQDGWDGVNKLNAAITALRDRLAQPEPVHASDISQERVDETAKRKHEPVAWRDALPGGRLTDKWESARIGDYNAGWNDYRKAAKEALEKLYTAPQKKEWVGLTTEEIYACDETSGLPQHEITNADLQAFAYAIEAKLKEKNT